MPTNQMSCIRCTIPYSAQPHLASMYNRSKFALFHSRSFGVRRYTKSFIKLRCSVSAQQAFLPQVSANACSQQQERMIMGLP